MAKMIESMAVVKVSKIIKDSEISKELLDQDLAHQLESIILELIGDEKALVEVIIDSE